MIELVGSMSLAVFGVVVYHLAQKLSPRELNPFLLLFCAYLASATICMILFLLTRNPATNVSLVRLLGAGAILGAAVVVVEFGFLLVYRSGWNIGIAGAFSTVSATLALLPIGIWLFHEEITMQNIVGLILALLGLYLSTKQ